MAISSACYECGGKGETKSGVGWLPLFWSVLPLSHFCRDNSFISLSQKNIFHNYGKPKGT
jgi:hypothetical protein